MHGREHSAPVSSASVLDKCLSQPVVFCSSCSSVQRGHAELHGGKSVFMLELIYSRYTKSKSRKSQDSTLGTDGMNSVG